MLLSSEDDSLLYCSLLPFFPSAVVFILLAGFVGEVLTVLGYGEGD